MIRFFIVMCAVSGAAFTICNAQDFARLPMRIVAATPAGGAADVNARRIADRLSRMLKQSVVVQNVAGGAGNIAAATIADATPNGNSMLFVAHPVLAVNPLLYTQLPFNAERDFVPVVLLSKTPHVLLVHTGLAAHNVTELLALAKARPGALNFASGGSGTSIHLAGELLRDLTGIDITHVPYKGGAPAVTALIGGEIQLLFDSTLTAISHVRGGRVRGIAVAGPARNGALPDIPTFEESGVRGFESLIAHGILLPARTPEAVVTALNRALNDILADPTYKKQMLELGADLVGGSSREFLSFLDAERRKWSAVIKRRGLRAN